MKVGGGSAPAAALKSLSTQKGWQKFYDTNLNKHYYYHAGSKTRQWDKPRGWVDEEAHEDEHETAAADDAEKRARMRQKAAERQMATKIQANFRGKAIRRELDQKKMDIRDASDARAKGLEPPKKERRKPAPEAQDQKKGSKAKVVDATKGSGRDEQRADEDPESAAATKLQSVFRGNVGRQRASQIAEAKQKEDAELGTAATALQTAFRAKAARKTVTKMKEEAEAAKEQEQVQLSMAATMLQAAFRGSVSRKTVTDLKAEKRQRSKEKKEAAAAEALALLPGTGPAASSSTAPAASNAEGSPGTQESGLYAMGSNAAKFVKKERVEKTEEEKRAARRRDEFLRTYKAGAAGNQLRGTAAAVDAPPSNDGSESKASKSSSKSTDEDDSGSELSEAPPERGAPSGAVRKQAGNGGRGSMGFDIGAMSQLSGFVNRTESGGKALPFAQAATQLDIKGLPGLTEGDMHKAFCELDYSKKGFLGASELRYALLLIGEQPSDEELDEMMKMVDIGGDGQASFEDFMQGLFRSNGPVPPEMAGIVNMLRAANAPSAEELERQAEEEAKRKGKTLLSGPSVKDIDLLIKGASGFMFNLHKAQHKVSNLPPVRTKRPGARRARPNKEDPPLALSAKASKAARKLGLLNPTGKGKGKGKDAGAGFPRPK